MFVSKFNDNLDNFNIMEYLDYRNNINKLYYSNETNILIKNKNTNENGLEEYFLGMILSHINALKDNNYDDICLKELEETIHNYNKHKGSYITIFYGSGSNVDQPIKKTTLESFIDYIDYIKFHYVIDANNHKISVECKNQASNKVCYSLIIDFKNNQICIIRRGCITHIVDYYKLDDVIDTAIKIIIDKTIKYYTEDKKLTIKVLYNQNPAKGKSGVIFNSIQSLLIILLSLRNKINKKIFSCYYYKYFLSNIVYDITKNEIKFTSNNKDVLLTYDKNKTTQNEIQFKGDCMLNVIMCTKKEKLHELIVQKISKIEKFNNVKPDYEVCPTDQLKNSLEKCVAEIETIINKMQNSSIIDNDFTNYKNTLVKYIEDYTTFITNIQKLNTQMLININDNISNPNLKTNMEYLKSICDLFDTHFLSLTNVLLDNACPEYVLTYKINYEKYKVYIQNMRKILELYQNHNIHNISYNDLLEFVKFIQEIQNIIYKIDMSVFYTNILITLCLSYYKVEYLFDDIMFNIINKSNNKNLVLKRFMNLTYNSNEINRTLCSYYNLNQTSSSYFLSPVFITGHALLSIIKINNEHSKINTKHYICDLNNLNIIAMRTKNEIEYACSFYGFGEFSFGDKRFGTEEYTAILKYWNASKNQNITEFFNNNKFQIPQNFYLYHYNLYKNNRYYFKFKCSTEPMFKQNSLLLKYIKLYITDKFNTSENNNYQILLSNDNIEIDICKIIKINNNNELEAYKLLFNDLDNKIKEYLLDMIDDKINDMINQTPTYNQKKSNNQKDQIIDNIVRHLKIIINQLREKKYTLENFIYELVYNVCHCLKKNISELKKYNFFININYLKIDLISIRPRICKNYKLTQFIQTLNDIIEIFNDTVTYENIFNGGNILLTYDTNPNKNIIMRILTIILIIVIIIIVVLIILFVIDKYNNNNVLTI